MTDASRAQAPDARQAPLNRLRALVTLGAAAPALRAAVQDARAAGASDAEIAEVLVGPGSRRGGA